MLNARTKYQASHGFVKFDILTVFRNEKGFHKVNPLALPYFISQKQEIYLVTEIKDADRFAVVPLDNSKE